MRTTTRFFLSAIPCGALIGAAILASALVIRGDRAEAKARASSGGEGALAATATATAWGPVILEGRLVDLELWMKRTKKTLSHRGSADSSTPTGTIPNRYAKRLGLVTDDGAWIVFAPPTGIPDRISSNGADEQKRVRVEGRAFERGTLRAVYARRIVEESMNGRE